MTTHVADRSRATNRDPAHAVRIYTHDGALLETVAEYLAAGARKGTPLVVIATPKHQARLRALLERDAVDVDALVASKSALFLDAHATLSTFMVDGRPDRALFRGAILPAVAREDGRPVTVYGEMAGRSAALALEDLWNEVRREVDGLDLLLTYSHDVSHAHDAVELRKTEAELSDFLENAVFALHQVDGEGRIVWANRAELTLLGYEASDYIGQNISTFHVDAHVIEELLQRLRNGEKVVDFPSRMRAKDGSERHVLITSNARTEDGKLVTTRCTTRDVTDNARSALRAEKLLKITSALAEAVAPEDVFNAVISETRAITGALTTGLWLVAEDGQSVSLARSDGYAQGKLDSFVETPLVAGLFPALDSILQAAPIWLETKAELLAKYPRLVSVVTERGSDYSVACLPLTTNGATRGSLAFTFEGRAVLDADERAFLLLVARYTGQALERLRLFELEKRRASHATLIESTARAIADASIGVTALLETVVQQVTLSFAESVGVFLRDRDRLVFMTGADRDPEALAVMRPLLSQSPPRLGEGIAGRVAETGESVLTPVIDPRSMLKPGIDPSISRFLPKSLITVALKTQGRVVGTLSVCRRDMPRFTRVDLDVIEEIAERAASAIERGRLYEENARSRTRAEIVTRVAGAANRAVHLRDVFDVSLTAMSELGAERSSILSFDDAGTMRFRAWRGLSDEYRAAVEGHSPWDKGATSFEPIMVDDVASDSRWGAYRHVFAREGIGALAFVPLVTGGALVGKFMLYWPGPHRLESDEMDAVTAIASHVAASIARFRMVGNLEETVRFNETFTGILAHDLRNPLNAIVTGAHLLARQEGATRVAERILRSGDRMSRMIDQLLDFTRVRLGGGIPIRDTRADLAALARKILEEHAADSHRLELVHEGNVVGPWDEDRLGQVLSNLIGNAIQHGRPGEKIKVGVIGASDGVRVEIKNAGSISADLLPRLFEPLAGEAKNRPGARGLGLGLFISRQIVEAHHGTIDVASDEAKGTVVRIWLPRSCEVP